MNIKSRQCPVCFSSARKADPFLPDTFDSQRVTSLSFASRKMPEFMSHGMVRCRVCDLVYVDRPPSQVQLAECYHSADFDSAEEAEDAAATYAAIIQRPLRRLDGRLDSALEIGTGSGVFLGKLADMGVTSIIGLEPSPAAIAAAQSHLRHMIREGIFEPDSFEPETFDLVCCFMTLEHVREPGELVRAAFGMLRPGGAFVSVTHDYRSLFNRMLGKRSPIIDIEHMQLFSARSATELLKRSGFEDVDGKHFRNSYRADYWLRLSPLPEVLKRGAGKVLHTLNLASRRVAINVGNVMTWGYKPA